jgi:hypothetical protein
MSIGCSYTYKGKQYSRERILRMLRLENQSLLPQDQTASTNWLKENLGMTDSEISVVKGLIDNRSLGRMIEDGNIILSEFASPGVAYHEAFHRVWNGFLSQDERSAFLRDFKQRKNWESLIEGYKKDYNLPTNRLIEEYLADEFANYVLSNGAMTIDAGMKSWFDKILDFIKKLLGVKSSDIFDLYEKINKGKFKKTPIYKISSYRDKIEIEGFEFTSDEKNQISQLIGARVLSSIIKNSPQTLRDFIKGKTNFNLWKIFSQAAYSIGEILEKNGNEKMANAIYEDLVKAIESDSPTTSKFYNFYRQYIVNLGIDSDANLAISEMEKQEQAMSDNDGGVGMNGEFTSNLEIDPRSNMSKQIKILLGSFYNTSDRTNLGLPKTYLWSQVFNEITQHMAGVPIEEFMVILN